MFRLTIFSGVSAVVFCLIPAAFSQSVSQLEGCDLACGEDLGGASCGDACCASGCREVCCHTRIEEKEEKSCWNVSCEKVCVPAIRCPWEPGGSGLTIFNFLHRKKPTDCGDCCDTCGCCQGYCDCGKCGAVRCIRVLEKEKYEVTTCKCKWEIRQVPICCGSDGCADPVGSCGEDLGY
jgi:hypothetical protein